jgi:hypothetical protein
VPEVNAANLRPILEAEIDVASHFWTDESGVYWKADERFASHRTVNHSQDEYVRGDASTNAAENYFSILKRGIYGIYHHVSEEHLHRYLAEFDFRYSNRIALGVNDVDRTERAIRGIIGKRLTYRTTRSQTTSARPPRLFWFDSPYREPEQLKLPFDADEDEDANQKGQAQPKDRG